MGEVSLCSDPLLPPSGSIFYVNFFQLYGGTDKYKLHVFEAAVPKLFGTRDRLRARQFFHGRDGRGVAANDASLPHLLFTSRCAARFLTRHGPVPVLGPRGWGPLI